MVYELGSGGLGSLAYTNFHSFTFLILIMAQKLRDRFDINLVVVYVYSVFPMKVTFSFDF